VWTPEGICDEFTPDLKMFLSGMSSQRFIDMARHDEKESFDLTIFKIPVVNRDNGPGVPGSLTGD
jgi:hypothetical protein